MRYKIVLEYDGSGFHGWQKQRSGCRTVQEEVERALSHLTADAAVTGSGRTDEGVHALGQVAHFDYDGGLDAATLMRALNHWLPEDICVKSCSAVPDTFDARKSARRKTYEYVMYTADLPSPLRRTRECYIGASADVRAMNEAAGLLKGTHDFSAFCRSGSSAKTFTRTIYDSEVREEGDRIIYRVMGNGFLYNMVRIMVGTLLFSAQGKIKQGEIKNIILSKDRKRAGKTAPPQGLYLNKINYQQVQNGGYTA